MDNEDKVFLSKWGKIRNRGLAVYLLSSAFVRLILFSAIVFGSVLLIDLYWFKLTPDLQNDLYLYGMTAAFVLSILTALVKWKRNQDRFEILNCFAQS